MKNRIFALAVALLLAGCGSQTIGSSTHSPLPNSPHTLTVKPPGIEKMPSVTVHLTFPTTLQKPDDLPADDVVIWLPLYPGSQKTDQAIPNFTSSNPMTTHSYLGTQEELMPASPKALENWFDQSFATLGYTPQVKGQSGNLKTGEVSYFADYMSKTDRVELSFFPKGSNQTLVLYRVEYSANPKRPSTSYLPTAINKIVITEGLEPLEGKPSRTVTIDDTKEISELVSKINALTVDTVLKRSCPMLTYSDAHRLSFYEPNGTVIQATISGCADLSINKTPLFDDQGIASLLRNKFPTTN